MSLVVVGGALANKPRNGGEAWVRLNWILGLRRLGHEVHLVEEIAAGACVDERGAPAAFEDSVNLDYFRSVVRRFGLEGRAALVYDGGRSVHGATWPELLDLAGAADLLVNISGHLALEPLFSRFRRRVYVDIDPGFTQFWHAEGNAGSRLRGHHAFYTIGENIGSPECFIPTGGIEWRHVRPPIVLERWPAAPVRPFDGFTTIANWRGPYGPVQWGDRTLGLKVHEFRKYRELPRLAAGPFELALGIHPADAGDLRALREHGWRVVDPLPASRDPGSFQGYVRGSGAEFSVAQGVYVETRSGWFSDRTVAYLASGRPALVQDTGFSRHYPTGEGLLAFRTLQEAVAGAEAIARDYPEHCRAARRLAEERFDSDVVLPRLLDEVASTSRRPVPAR